MAGMLAATPTVANDTATGNHLHSICQSDPNGCLGYALAVRDGIRLGLVAAAGLRWAHETFTGEKREQTVDFIIKSLGVPAITCIPHTAS